MRPALVSKSGSRGKIQQRCCQGRMASSFSQRQMVVSLREAVNPQARTIILARATIKYGNVYLLARRSSSPRSCSVRAILYGLFRGKLVPSQSKHSREGAKTDNNTLSYLLKGALSALARLKPGVTVS